MAVQTPAVGISQVNGSFSDFVPSADRGFAAAEAGGDSSLKPMDTADATKITYYTPRWEGVQLGMSYAPERDSLADGEGVQTSDTTGNHDNAIELGLNYAREFNGISLKLSGEYNHADAKNNSVEEISAWGVGGQIGYQGFAFGGTYYNNGDSGLATGTADDQVQAYALGLTYKTDDWGVAASFAQVDFDQNATPFEVIGATGSGGEYTVYGVGGSYKLAPGLTAGADLMFFDRNRDTGTDTDGYVLVTEVRAAF